MFESTEGGSPIAQGEVAPGQQVFITLTEGRTNVLEVTGEDSNNMADLAFVNQPTADTPILINVDTTGTGGVFQWAVADQAGIGGVRAPYILWNFDGTTSLTLVPKSATVEGGIYAPDADFTDLSLGDFEGQIVAANAVLGTDAYHSNEVHYYPFDTTLTCGSNVNPSPSDTTDEPTSSAASTEAPSSEAPPSDMPAGPNEPGTIPVTGSALMPFGIAAVLPLGSGTAVLLLGRRRG